MDIYPSLDSYGQFSQSSQGPFFWGDGGRSTVAYNSDVIPDLVAGLEALPRLAAERMPRRAEARPTVLACVYRLTSKKVVNALIPLDCCLIVDRQQGRLEEPQRLHDAGRPVSSQSFSGFSDLVLPGPDGKVPVIGPYGGMPEPLMLGPVRAAGWRAPAGRGDSRPLLHTKMLVAGRTWIWEDDNGQEAWRFTPLRTWMGSANWTTYASSHLEFGVWSDDATLLEHNTTYLLEMIRLSQPLDSATTEPTPDLADAEWADDREFREAYEEQRLAERAMDEDRSW